MTAQDLRRARIPRLNEPRKSVTLSGMSFTQVMEELPGLTVEQRQLLVRRALELDDDPISAAELATVESRLAAHHAAPSSSLSLEEMKNRLRSR